MADVVAESVIVFGTVVGLIVAFFYGALAMEVKHVARQRRLLEEEME